MLQSLLEWIRNNQWLLEIKFYAIVTALVFIAWTILHRKITAKGHHTTTPWDNILLSAIGVPVSLLIVLAGLFEIGITTAAALGDNYIRIGDTLAGMRSLLALAIFLWVAIRMVNGVELHYRSRNMRLGTKEIHRGTLYAIFQAVRGVLFAIAALTAMDALGLSISGLLTIGGIGGILIGFAAKDTLANFFSGLLIFWERPFIVGDWIRRPDAGVEGTVENIGWRTTQIRTFDKRPLYVPNSLFFNSVIENPQRMTNRRIYEYIGIRYQDIPHLPAVLRDIRTMLASHAGIDQTQIQMVYFDRYGASSLDFFIYVMTKTVDWGEFHRVKEDVLLQIGTIVHRHQCDFAFPTRTLHHESPPPAHADIPI